MQYTSFQKYFRNYTVFSLTDIRQIEPRFDRRRLNEWQKKKYIKKVIRNYYIFFDLSVDERILFEIANRIYCPSYVSFEIALAYYGLIPESVYGVTSVSTCRTSHFVTSVGEFFYRTVRPKFYFGFNLLRNGGKLFKIASPEKALLDIFYIKTELRDTADFEGLRVNPEVFRKIINKEKLYAYLAAYRQKSLKKRIDNFWEYIQNA